MNMTTASCPAGTSCPDMLCDRCSESKARALIAAGKLPPDVVREWRGNTRIVGLTGDWLRNEREGQSS